MSMSDVGDGGAFVLLRNSKGSAKETEFRSRLRRRVRAVGRLAGGGRGRHCLEYKERWV